MVAYQNVTNSKENISIRLCTPKLSSAYFILCILTWVVGPIFVLLFFYSTELNVKEPWLWLACGLPGILLGFIPALLFIYLIIPFCAIFYGFQGLCMTASEIDEDNICASIFPSSNQIAFWKLFEQVGEALPQFLLAVTFYINHSDYINTYDTLFGSAVPVTLVSIIFSSVSVVIGLLTGLKQFKKMYDEGKFNANEGKVSFESKFNADEENKDK